VRQFQDAQRFQWRLWNWFAPYCSEKGMQLSNRLTAPRPKGAKCAVIALISISMSQVIGRKAGSRARHSDSAPEPGRTRNCGPSLLNKAFARRRPRMSRSILDDAHIHPSIRETIANNHADIVEEVKDAVARNDIVIVGMAQNPMPKKARKLLDQKHLGYKYLEYGSYLRDWRRRNALKMWTGWPTFPMIFIKGVLVGGANDLQKLLESGELAQLLGSKT
jgi:monothiol glutaredoxin